MTKPKLKAAYSIPELAEMSGLDVDRVRRILKSNGVTLSRNGRVYLVWLSDLKRCLPDLWESIQERLSIIRAA